MVDIRQLRHFVAVARTPREPLLVVKRREPATYPVGETGRRQPPRDVRQPIAEPRHRNIGGGTPLKPRSPRHERWSRILAVAAIFGGAVVGLGLAFTRLSHLHIWAAYGNFFACFALGVAAAYLIVGRD